KEMQPGATMPHLVKALEKTDWQDVLEPLLLGCPEPPIVIPLLVDELGKSQRRKAAGNILLKFFHNYGKDGPGLLQWLLPGLENTNARAYTKGLITQMVYQQYHKADLLPDIVSLFEPAAARPE